MANSVRKNTVKLIFGPGSKTPSYLEVLKFTIDILKLSAADIHSIYKDENGGQFYCKLIDEPTFSAFIGETEEGYTFRFDDGTTAHVQVDQASRIFRYVRVFNLPPEIEDREIQYVLGQYGTIRQHVRERFPSEAKVNIYTGVRGVHMEISKEIPPHLYIGHFRARIFYDGLKNKCFFCKAEGHVKSSCPKLAAISTGSGSRSDSSDSAPLGRPVKPVIDRSGPSPLSMTVLNQRTKATSPTASSSNEQPLQLPTSKPSCSSAPIVQYMEQLKTTVPETISVPVDKSVHSTSAGDERERESEEAQPGDSHLDGTQPEGKITTEGNSTLAASGISTRGRKVKPKKKKK